MTQLFWLLTSFTCCMFALVAHRIFKIIYSCSLQGVIFSQPCFLPFPSNVVSHIFVVFFSLHSLQSPSTLILPDHRLCFSSQSCKFYSSYYCHLSLMSTLYSFLATLSFHLPLSFLVFYFPSLVTTPGILQITLAKWVLGNFLVFLSLWLSVPIRLRARVHIHTHTVWFGTFFLLCFLAPSQQELCQHPLCILLTCFVNVCWRNSLLDFSTFIPVAQTLIL